MKKFFSMLLLAPMALALVACNESLDPSVPQDSQNNSAPEDTNNPPENNTPENNTPPEDSNDGNHVSVNVYQRPEVSAVMPSQVQDQDPDAELDLQTEASAPAEQKPLLLHCPVNHKLSQDKTECVQCPWHIDFETAVVTWDCSE